LIGTSRLAYPNQEDYGPVNRLVAGRQGSSTPDHAGRTSETGFAVSRFDAKKPPAAPLGRLLRDPYSEYQVCDERRGRCAVEKALLSRQQAHGYDDDENREFREKATEQPEDPSLTIMGFHDTYG
jgi:hypothetical protein